MDLFLKKSSTKKQFRLPGADSGISFLQNFARLTNHNFSQTGCVVQRIINAWDEFACLVSLSSMEELVRPSIVLKASRTYWSPS